MIVFIDDFAVQIDEASTSIVTSYRWTARKNPVGQIYFMSGKLYLHRLITNCPEDMVVDHINGDSLDNRTINLRICTKLQNQYNQKKHKGHRHSLYKGVTFRKDLKSKPWEAFIYAHGKSKRLGYFTTEIEAALAYNEAAQKHYGEFARLNTI